MTDHAARPRRSVNSAPPAQAEVAVRVWVAMHAFVMANDRNRELQQGLGLGRGTGRVKVLLMLLDGPATLREIAEANQIDAPYTTVIVDKLENLGLVERTAHPDGRRRKLVKLSEVGQEAVERAKRILSEPPAGLAALAPADLDLLDEIFSRLAAPPATAPAASGD
jgi:DNA-binding MarR family transcriptional regulator